MPPFQLSPVHGLMTVTSLTDGSRPISRIALDLASPLLLSAMLTMNLWVLTLSLVNQDRCLNRTFLDVMVRIFCEYNPRMDHACDLTQIV